MKIDTSKLQQAERLIHEWAEKYQAQVSQFVLNEAIKGELACSETVAFIRQGF